MLFCKSGIVKIKRLMISRRLISKGFAFTLPFFLAFGATYGNAENADDYTRLLELIQLDDQQQPLYVFNDFEEEFDKASHRATQQYFKEHPGLIQRIKDKLEGGKLRWKLRNLKHRLLFVPENRAEYVALYKNYCLDVIDTILDKTGFDNPYDNIQTLSRSKPVRHEKNEGVTAYIVHNLAKEYVGTYIFSNQTDKKVKIELEGKLYSGDVGAYTSTLIMNENGTIEFIKDKYTIWQNSADNPFTALMVPAEETLHIALRDSTESAIKKDVEQSHQRSLKSVEQIVEDWMAVEEAIVGGIVYRLLPHILEEHITDLSLSDIEMDIIAKRQFEKYRHLEKGITIVKEIGYGEAIRMYSKDPAAFRDLLL
ncbi:MAG: hypothetical protein OET57_11715 [Desulfobacteraceae bacterium]|nr:hypothetical protein [Desulfobacteraceae bacterium]MDH3837408.1 hypothetical protein [Desulfobacteraceae bacterium]